MANLQVNGQDAYTTTAAVGTQPVLSWSAPQLGSANGYLVALVHLYLRAGTTQTTSQVQAQIYTTQTRIVLPPDQLKSGEYYVFRVVSLDHTSYDVGSPYHAPIPQASAATLSTMVTP